MEGGDHGATIDEKELSVLSRNSEILTDQGLGSNPAEADNQRRVQKSHLTVKPDPAGRGLRRKGIAITRRTAFEDVGDIDLISIEVDDLHHVVKQFPGRARERNPLQVFLLSGGFAHEEEIGLAVPIAEDKVGPR